MYINQPDPHLRNIYHLFAQLDLLTMLTRVFFVIGLSYGNGRYSTHLLINGVIVNIWTLFKVLLRFYINTACCFDIS